MTRVQKNKPWVNLLDIRDGQQSTLKVDKIIFDTNKLVRILAAASDAGFKSAEVAGGQYFQSAIKRGYNPFNLLEYMDMITCNEKGEKTINLQMLFRGANALGFKHHHPITIEKTLEEFKRLGINKFRIFDALNDIDNIYIPNSLKGSKVEIQGALCFGHYSSQENRYTDDYYVNYAQKLIEKGCNSIAIKDMSGQLDGKRAKSLVSKLKERFPMIPLELHIHSTNENKSQEAVQAAIQAGIDGIETVEGPLKKGSSHHDYATFYPSLEENHKHLVYACQETFGEVASRRFDKEIPPDIKSKLCAIGVPGGAMPFVYDYLQTRKEMIARNHNNQAFFMKGYNGSAEEMYVDQEWTLRKSIELFTLELPRVCKDANYPLLVTPTADICCTQAIFNLEHGSNLTSDSLEDRYNLTSSDGKFPKADIRFIKLILGHYGEMKEYSDVLISINPVTRDVKSFFSDKQNVVTAKDDHPYKTMLDQNDTSEWSVAQKQAQQLIKKYPIAARSFASLDQLTIMYILKPQGGQGDPIEQALQGYIKRNLKDSQTRGCHHPRDFDLVLEPLFKHLDNLAAIGKLPTNIFEIKIADFKELGARMIDTYEKIINGTPFRTSFEVLSFLPGISDLFGPISNLGDLVRNLYCFNYFATNSEKFTNREEFDEQFEKFSSRFNGKSLTFGFDQIINSIKAHVKKSEAQKS
jgi:oxaloacetate decarboxylase alpha subunit